MIYYILGMLYNINRIQIDDPFFREGTNPDEYWPDGRDNSTKTVK